MPNLADSLHRDRPRPPLVHFSARCQRTSPRFCLHVFVCTISHAPAPCPPRIRSTIGLLARSRIHLPTRVHPRFPLSCGARVRKGLQCHRLPLSHAHKLIDIRLSLSPTPTAVSRALAHLRLLARTRIRRHPTHTRICAVAHTPRPVLPPSRVQPVRRYEGHVWLQGQLGKPTFTVAVPPVSSLIRTLAHAILPVYCLPVRVLARA
ncbi:hypothetical protein EVG20_g10060 [Dentipellis fragilis]|uniref:Uncharacterized protein n=1 Tax=Dentipellis fragilis TaxID=205917 RepID=A0A4Y9XYB6_9AGAM|nr:hypothetical protein EVG20_g10060 [Dentipellis fragilis]